MPVSFWTSATFVPPAVFAAILGYTQDYGGMDATDAMAQLTGTNSYYRNLMSAELNAVWNGVQASPAPAGAPPGSFAVNPLLSASSIFQLGASTLNGQTVSAILTLAYNTPSALASTDLVNAVAYLGANGHNIALAQCGVQQLGAFVPSGTRTQTGTPAPASGSPSGTPSPSRTASQTASPSGTPSVTASGTATPILCTYVRSPGFWAGYANRMTAAQFAALLAATPDFSAYASNVAGAVALLSPVTTAGVQPSNPQEMQRYLLSAELNAVWNGNAASPSTSGGGAVLTAYYYYWTVSGLVSTPSTLNGYAITRVFAMAVNAITNPPPTASQSTNTTYKDILEAVTNIGGDAEAESLTYCAIQASATAQPTQSAPATVGTTGTPSPAYTYSTPANLCAYLRSPGFWKNYQWHMTDAQMQAIINVTPDYAGTLPKIVSKLVDTNTNPYQRLFVASELNAAWNGNTANPAPAGTSAMANAVYYAAGSAYNGMTVPSILSAIKLPNTNPTADQWAFVYYMSGDGEYDTAAQCKLQPPPPSPTGTPSLSGTRSGSPSRSVTPSATGTPSVSGTPSGTRTPSHTGTPSASATTSPSLSGTPSTSGTASASGSPSASGLPSTTGTPSASSTASASGTASTTGSPSGSATPSPSNLFNYCAYVHSPAFWSDPTHISDGALGQVLLNTPDFTSMQVADARALLSTTQLDTASVFDRYLLSAELTESWNAVPAAPGPGTGFRNGIYMHSINGVPSSYNGYTTAAIIAAGYAYFGNGANAPKALYDAVANLGNDFEYNSLADCDVQASWPTGTPTASLTASPAGAGPNSDIVSAPQTAAFVCAYVI
jgi:hypothetical protein